MRWIAFFPVMSFALLMFSVPGTAQILVLPSPSRPAVHSRLVHPQAYGLRQRGLFMSLMNKAYVRPQSLAAEQGVDARRVTISLCVTPPGASPSVNFRLKRAGEVVAEQPAEARDELEYELLIHGPAGDFKVHVPIGAKSTIRAAYDQYGATEPEKVVEAIANCGEPVVRVVAIRRRLTTSQHFETDAAKVAEFTHWTPYYRIQLGDPETAPTLVQVPRADDAIYRLAQRKANLRTTRGREVIVAQISGTPEDRLAEASPSSTPEPVEQPDPNDLPFTDPFSSDEA